MHRHHRVAALLILAAIALAPAFRSAEAQISLVSAVDLALKNNPRVRLAQADIDKSTAVLKESKDVYIPAITVGSGLGWSYGYPLGQPSVVNAQLTGALLNWSQRDLKGFSLSGRGCPSSPRGLPSGLRFWARWSRCSTF